jgi:ketosteroid isomerase-like protein
MNSLAGPIEPRGEIADSPNMRVIKGAFEAQDESGVEGAIEHLLSHSHPDVEFRPYVAEGRVLRGRAEVRSFYREQLDTGTLLVLRPTSFEESGDDVVVNGSLRIVRPAGGFAESQLSWTYRFREGLLQTARWSPRQAA